jgi:hypothetical protein
MSDVQHCKEPGCNESAVGSGSTGRCPAHGEGNRCEEKGCQKSAEGTTGRCITHRQTAGRVDEAEILDREHLDLPVLLSNKDAKDPFADLPPLEDA